MHAPASHTSKSVQNRPSSQGKPSPCGMTLQPSTGSQNPSPHSLSRNEQSTGAPGMHTPPPQKPVSVQGLSSMQPAPSLPGISVQPSVTRSHVPTWHESLAGQNFSIVAVQTPILHASVRVQLSPSSQGVSSFAGSFEHSPLIHVPVLHESVSATHSAAEVHGSPAPIPPLPPAPPGPGPVVGAAPAPSVVPVGSTVVLVAHAEAPSRATTSVTTIDRS